MKNIKTFDIKSGGTILKLSVIEHNNKIFVDIGPKFTINNDVCVDDRKIRISFIEYCRISYRVEEIIKLFSAYYKDTTK